MKTKRTFAIQPYLIKVIALALALYFSVAFCYLHYRYDGLAITDETLKKLLILALTPTVLIDYQVLRLRSAMSSFLSAGAALLAV